MVRETGPPSQVGSRDPDQVTQDRMRSFGALRCSAAHALAYGLRYRYPPRSINERYRLLGPVKCGSTSSLVPGWLLVLDDSTRYQILSLLEDNPELSQRELADKMDISLGKTNYCLNALIDKGLIKAHNFRNSRNKAAYLYKLTPAGINERIRVTRRFLKCKLLEHVELSAEIERLRCEVQSHKRSRSEEPLDNH